MKKERDENEHDEMPEDKLPEDSPEVLDSIKKLSKDIKSAAITLSQREARYLVDLYYQMQKNRIRSGHHVRTLSESGEPNAVFDHLLAQNYALERQVQSALGYYGLNHPAGKWCHSITGIGPVITAALLAYTDITKCPTVGHLYSFAGVLDSTVEKAQWRKGELRPWAGTLKTVVWHAGQCLMKTHTNKKSQYGAYYRTHKARIIDINEAGGYAEAAARKLKESPNHAQKATYAEGKLPAGHIEARAQRATAKMFLSHFHAVLFASTYGRLPSRPYAVAHIPGHSHIVPVPNWPFDWEQVWPVDGE
jgi:hypothetical protein